mgnify:CR=1 FL=1
MPFYKTKILNREISLEYEKKDEKKIIDSINLINKKIDDKLQNPKYSNGKISDTILLSLLSIELQAELSEKLNIERSSEVNDAKNEEYLKKNLELKDKILKLQNFHDPSIADFVGIKILGTLSTGSSASV